MKHIYHVNEPGPEGHCGSCPCGWFAEKYPGFTSVPGKCLFESPVEYRVVVE